MIRAVDAPPSRWRRCHARPLFDAAPFCVMATPSESPIVARVRALVARVNGAPFSADEREARLGRETDPQKIVALAREIDASNSPQAASQSQIEELEARLGVETDPQKIVALARQIDAMKSPPATGARRARRCRFW